MVGYWDAPWCAKFKLPRPDGLIRVGWRLSERDKIVEYLRRGVPLLRFFGFAKCRLCEKMLGSKDLTDGEWVWPERLEHYITDHDITLPRAFIATMQRNGWSAPAGAEVTVANSCNGQRLFYSLYKYEAFDYWRQWAARHSRSPAVPAEPAEIVDQPQNSREGQSITNVIRSVLGRLIFGSNKRGG